METDKMIEDFFKESRISDIEEEICDLEAIFDYLYLPEETYKKATEKIGGLNLELERLKGE